MVRKSATQPLTARPPRGLLRLLLRAPIWLYRLRLGRLLGHRFLLLTHTGRRSSLPRQVVIEVVHYDPANNTHIVASGWGEKSQWLQNIEVHPEVQIDSGGRRFEAIAVRLPEEQARQALLTYAQGHPVAFQEIVRMLFGRRSGDTEEICDELVRAIPLIAFHPKLPS